MRKSTLLCAALLLAAAFTALGQNYPSRPIRIVASEIGGTGDFALRTITQGSVSLQSLLGQPIVVDNRATSIIPEIMGKAAPDGYTMLVIGAGFWNGPALHKMDYDPIKDFVPVVMISNAPEVLVVNTGLAAKSVKDLIALAKAQPGKLNYAYTIPGTPVHIGSELFKSMAGIDVVGIRYRGTSQMMTALVGGEVQMMIAPVAAAVPQVKAGRLRALAIASAQPSTLLPDIPTIAGSGLPGYEAGNTTGMFAPQKTPRPIVQRLYQATAQILSESDIRERLLAAGVEAIGSSPEDFTAAIKAEMARVSKVAHDSGLKIE
jgi:tripartite-type tricarboxylate transporter receptor subunit TctC